MKDRLRKIRNTVIVDGHIATQAEFAAMVGKTRDAISNLELGRTVPDASLKMLICEKFGVRMEYIETGKEPMFYPEADDCSDIDMLIADPSSPTAKLVRSILISRAELKPAYRQIVDDYIASVIKKLSE